MNTFVLILTLVSGFGGARSTSVTTVSVPDIAACNTIGRNWVSGVQRADGAVTATYTCGDVSR